MDEATGGSSYPLLLGITCGGVCFYFNLIGFVFVFVGGGRGGVSRLFVCLWFIVSLDREFSTHMETHHLRGPLTPTPIVERLAVELALPVFRT